MELFAQILGYIGMALVVASFLFKNIKLVRIVNISGAVLSATFAFMLMGIQIGKATDSLAVSNAINSFLPTAILNTVLIGVNVTMLFIENKKKAE